MAHTYNNFFNKITSLRKGKSKKFYVIEFEANLRENLLNLQKELSDKTYLPKPLKIFILRDPKTRKIAKSIIFVGMAPGRIEPPNYPRQGYSLPLAYEADFILIFLKYLNIIFFERIKKSEKKHIKISFLYFRYEHV